MARCKSCDGFIVWITMKGGKRMPCDGDAFWLLPDPEGGEVAVAVSGDDSGEVVRGRKVQSKAPGTVVARTSHFATCPQAAQHRKAKEQ